MKKSMPNERQVLEAERLERWDNTEDVKELLSVIHDGKILEIGCGTGKIIEELSQHLPTSVFVGIDIIKYFLEIATMKSINNALFIYADATADIFPENVFSTVLFRDALHAIRQTMGDRGVEMSLNNAYRFLNKGGIVVIRDSLRIPRGRLLHVKFTSIDVKEIYRIFATVTEQQFSGKDSEVEIDIRELIAFLGKFRTIKMNPDIKNLEATLHYSLEEYDQLLQDVGFQKGAIKLYKFPKGLIPDGVVFDSNRLPETYCMLIYQK